MRYLQQGDVLLKKISKLPEGHVKTESLVLQHGETTGHKHRFLDDGNVEVYVNPDGQLLSAGATIVWGVGKVVVVKAPSQLLHEEHKPITVMPGIYEMDLVREYDYEADEAKYVVD